MAIGRESTEQSLARWNQLKTLQEFYPSFSIFLEDAMDHLGFNTTWMQHDIGAYVENGGRSIMVQAQRAQAKTTITAIYAVFCLIHEPQYRILIVSAGENTSNQISTLIIRLIMTMEGLDCLRPDKQKGDRTSIEAFDVHYGLKGVDKSPSVACIGIMGSFTGSRADLVIADDVEGKKNSITAAQREKLVEVTSEFTDIVDTGGRIIYLGTPQSTDSIYNNLPSRGFQVRIWPGRFPTTEQARVYGEHLAPKLIEKMERHPEVRTGGGILGDQGQPTDPERISELELQKKEMEKTTPRFQLQYMLNTTLADKLKFPLKTENLIVAQLDNKLYPMFVAKDPRETHLKKYSVSGHSFQMGTMWYEDTEKFKQHAELQSKIMYIDPAGGGVNGDETAYCVIGFLNGNIFLLSAGGIAGGYSIDGMDFLADLALKHKPNEVIIEKNFGYGAFREVFLPVLRAKYECAVSDDMVSGQKERRIESILGPVLARNSLVVSSTVMDEDEDACNKYPAEKRKLYSLFFQLSKMTLVKGCLAHDDRLDALAGAVNHYVKYMAIDQADSIKKKQEAELNNWLKDPLLHNRYSTGPKRSGSTFDKYRK